MAASLLLAGAIVAASAALLAGPSIVVAREMSWDLLFNLVGAWHLSHGQVPHVDFHEPVGQLYFRLTQLGFWLCGPSVKAFVVGDIVVGAVIFGAAAATSPSRLPPAATMVFILFTSLMVLMPVGVGDAPTDFNFAMSYNAYGWSAISVLSLILFVPRLRSEHGVWIDAAIGGLLLVGMYYLKMTYFAVAMAELGVAFVVSRHVRHRAWVIAGALAAANAVAPYNWPYLRDLADVLAIPGTLTDYFQADHLRSLLRSNLAELALYAATGAVSLGLWLAGRASVRLPLIVALLIAMAAALLVFNTQTRGLPLAVVSLFVLFDRLRTDDALRRLAPALLVYPLWLIGTAGVSVASYHLAAREADELMVVDRTNLRGLAVPAGDPPIKPGEEIDQDDYVGTILEAASLLRQTRNGGQGIALLDQVNPMAFVLGLRPLHGARLWLDVDFPWPAADAMFSGVNHVLIPKRPTYAAVTDKALGLYGDYMTRNFPIRTESRSWTMLSRVP